jgi:hypothetical protein
MFVDPILVHLIEEAELVRKTETVLDFFSNHPRLFFFNRERQDNSSDICVIIDECVPFGEIQILKIALALRALLSKYPMEGIEMPRLYSLDGKLSKALRKLQESETIPRYNKRRRVTWVYQVYNQYLSEGTENDLYALFELNLTYYTLPVYYDP